MDEVTINIETVRIRTCRATHGNLADLAASIEADGLRHPITVWTDGTLISGARRLRAHYMLASGDKLRSSIKAVFVDTIEDAAKRLAEDNADGYLAEPMKPTEMLRLWEVLRHLDKPAAARRLAAARRRGVELRRQTLAGKRKPGKVRSNTEDYVMSVLAAPFDMSEATASRLSTTNKIANDDGDARQQTAREILYDLDRGIGTIWGGYARLVSGRQAPPSKPKVIEPVEPAPAAKQLSAWARALPQMEGLTAGLAELGGPNKELTWEQVGPVHARLAAVRRDLEKMIKNMKEFSQ